MVKLLNCPEPCEYHGALPGAHLSLCNLCLGAQKSQLPWSWEVSASHFEPNGRKEAQTSELCLFIVSA